MPLMSLMCPMDPYIGISVKTLQPSWVKRKPRYPLKEKTLEREKEVSTRHIHQTQLTSEENGLAGTGRVIISDNHIQTSYSVRV